MERIINSNKDTQTIYEIYRACRLCGAGAGYKMPIIQSVVDLDGNGVELKQKILECLQIEVHQEDKMPPLICELCVDKVNDFYEFLDLCRQINKRTRQRLGLPLQAVTRPTASESSDCILGVTEPVYVPDNDDEPLTRSRSSKSKNTKTVTSSKNANVKIKMEPDVIVKIKKEPELRVKLEKNISQKTLMEQMCRQESRRTTRQSRELSSSPPRVRVTRNSSNDDNATLSSLKQQVKSEKSSTSSKSSASKSSPSSKVSPVSKPGPASKSNNTSKPGPASKTNNLKPGPASKTNNSKPGPASKSSTASKSEPTSKPGPASKTSSSSKSGSTSKPGPASKSSSGQNSSPGLKSILKKDTKKEEESSPTLRGKRLREREPEKDEVPLKKLRISIEKMSPPKPKSKRPASPPPMPLYTCGICTIQSKNSQGHMSHMRSHLPNFTNPKLACNPCGEWFSNADETAAHHRLHRTKHKPYHCRKCDNDFKQLQEYDDHFEDECVPDEEVPDIKCDDCWQTFATENLLDDHRCHGEDSRPGGKCFKCNRAYALLKNLKKHESTCTAKKKGGTEEAKVDPSVLAQLLPLHVRMARCDSLLPGGKRRLYDVSEVPSDFGLDRDCIYPYRFYRSWFKSEFTGFDSMVSIKDDVKNEFCNQDFVHWDSEESGESDSETLDSVPKKSQIETLAALTLKIIFSQRFVGKVPRKRRKVKVDKCFDNSEFDTDLSKDINNIINNLNDDNTDSINSDSIINNIDSINTEKMFDDLLNENDSKVNDIKNNVTQDTTDSIKLNDSEDKKSENLHTSNEDRSKTGENAMDVDETYASTEENHKKADNISANDANNDEAMDTSENDVSETKKSSVSSNKETLENKISNSTEDINENKSQNNDSKVNGDSKQYEVNDEEMNDKRLMEEIDAQIGEDNDNLKNDKCDENNDDNSNVVDKKVDGKVFEKIDKGKFSLDEIMK